MDIRGQTALITGASSGIGTCFARQLAVMGCNLVITARRKDRLETLAQELREQHHVEVSVIPLDLGTPDAAEALFKLTEGAEKSIDILINNAGFGKQELFADLPWEDSLGQLQVNLVTLTELTYRFVQKMRDRGRGAILNVSSIGAYLPVPYFAVYAATKAYVRNFTEALAQELKNTPLKLCCLCPGGTKTEFSEVAGQELNAMFELSLMSADRCAKIGLKALFRGRRNIVSGWLNTLLCFSLRFTPRRLFTWAAGLVMGK